MARVTVEDCIDKVDNRFELVLLAAHRARMISSGAELTVDRERDKNTVVALREIAEQTLLPEDLQQNLIESMQKNVEVDEPDLPAQPLVMNSALDMAGMDQPDVDPDAYDRLSEEDLLRGLEQIKPPSADDDDD